MKRYYFDYNATTPLAPDVLQTLQTSLADFYKNPSSVHQDGQKARKQMERARENLSQALDCASSHLVFTSGATESNNAVFESVWRGREPHRNKIVTIHIEHDSVLMPLKCLEEQGATIEFISIDRRGFLDEKKLEMALDENTLLFSMMLANNETGMILPAQKWAAFAKKKGIWVHSDAACAIGKIPISFRELEIDFMSASAHKFYGPKGIGLLILRPGAPFEPLLLGGTHEGGRRAGTQNVEGILGMEAALKFSLENIEDEIQRQSQLRQKIKDGLHKIYPTVIFHEHSFSQLPGTLHVAFPGFNGQILLTRLDLEGVSASYGSACHSGALEVSRVLLAMGISEEEAVSSIRLSFGRMTTEGEVGELMGIFLKILNSKF